MTGSDANMLCPQGETLVIGNEKKSIENKSSDCKTANQILMLEKNIDFIKHQHSQMIAALHFEIERLKKVNQDIQRRLFLETGSVEVKEEGADNEDLQKKIYALESQLKAMQEKNALLKRELEARKRHNAAKKHNVAESHSPVIQKAEQIRNPSDICMDDDMTTVAGDFPGGNRQKWEESSHFLEQNRLNLGSGSRGSQLLSALTMSYNVSQSDLTLPPIKTRPDTAGSSVPGMSILSDRSHTETESRVGSTTKFLHKPVPKPRITARNVSSRSTSAGGARRRGDSAVRLTPLKQVPPLPTMTSTTSRRVPGVVVSSPLVPGITRKAFLPSVSMLAGLPPRHPTGQSVHLLARGDARPTHTSPGPLYNCRSDSYTVGRNLSRRQPVSSHATRQSIEIRPQTQQQRPADRRRLNSERTRKGLP